MVERWSDGVFESGADRLARPRRSAALPDRTRFADSLRLGDTGGRPLPALVGRDHRARRPDGPGFARAGRDKPPRISRWFLIPSNSGEIRV